MKLSNRITNITKGGSDGWDVFYKARAMKDAGEDVIELTIGEHDIKTEEPILTAMYDSAMAGNTGYAIVPGMQPLREAIATRVQTRTGVETSFENIIVTPGGQAALFATHTAVLNPGDTALYLDPYYATYPGTLRAAGAIDLPIQTSPENDFQPTRAELEAHAKGARSLLMNSPNNPSGVVYSRETIEMICDVVRANDLWLISDEVYDTQVWTGEHLTPRAQPHMAERTLVVGSMSKSHAMTGSRVGWIVAPKDVITKLIDLSTCTTYGVPGFIQAAALFALEQGDPLEKRVGEVFRRRRALAQEALKGVNALHTVPSSGAMYLMLDIRATGLSGEDFALALLEAEMIAVMPGESFGKAAAGHIRVAMTVEDSRFVDALKRLATFAQSKIT
ncbi:MAG: aminotransferase class I/II-fold pyridoxal phosphate-dependent enzyme [Alphaproteobacteria bacterium]|nr:aminotransferase class I/II-fold pyridoxal phosphate-dependent enzyme [Alphaproteobacteria bacterium]